MLAAGALGYGGSVMVQNAGIARTSVTHAALLIGAVPVLVAVIAAAWYRAVAAPVAWFGFAVSLGGVGLVTVGGGGGGATLAGDGLVLVSLLLSATVTVAQGRLLTGRDPVAVTAVQFLGATLGALPVAVLTEGVPAPPARRRARCWRWPRWRWRGTLAAVHPVRVRSEPGARPRSPGRSSTSSRWSAPSRARWRSVTRWARAGGGRPGHRGGHRAEQPAADRAGRRGRPGRAAAVSATAPVTVEATGTSGTDGGALSRSRTGPGGAASRRRSIEPPGAVMLHHACRRRGEGRGHEAGRPARRARGGSPARPRAKTGGRGPGVGAAAGRGLLQVAAEEGEIGGDRRSRPVLAWCQ